MQDLTLSQEYLLCTLTEKGRLPVMNTAGPVCLTAGALLELQLAGCVAFDGKKVRVTAPLPVEEAHLHTRGRVIPSRWKSKVKISLNAFSSSVKSASVPRW